MNTRKTKNKIWKLPNLFFIIFLSCIFLLYLKFMYLSLSPTIYGKNMKQFAQNRNTVKRTIKATRGSIYDSEENPLAINVSSYTIIASLEKSKVYMGEDYVKDVDKTAEALAPLINVEVDYLKKILSQDRYQVELGPNGRGITELKKDEIEALNLPGIGFTESQKRFYPNGDFASYVVGYAKTNEVVSYDENDNKSITEEIVGELGIEAKYNEKLSGTDGYLEYQQNRYGYKISGTKEYSTEAEDGNDIYLTLDSNIQRFVETEIKNLDNTYHPEWATIAVMDAKTGDILATSSTPSFDPNIRNITNYENPFVTFTFEPGSTMKTYTYMCALENNTYNGDEMFTSGNYTIGEYTINDWNVYGWGDISLDKGYEYSSNVGIANILMNHLTKKQLQDCYKKYGFGEKTGIELAREQSGNTSFQYDIEYVTAGYGQGITTTVIQQLQALTILSNNGKMLKPHIVKKIVNNNEIVYERKIEESEQLVKTSTINKMKDLMYNVIHGTDVGSTGYPYRIDGFDIIGKTGTSQLYDPNEGTYLIGDNLYIFSFAGMYPKDNPEIIIYAAMKKPTWGKSSGLSTATKNVMQSIAKYKNMFTEMSEKQINTYETSSYLNKDVDIIKIELQEHGIIPIILGDGNRIIRQSIPSGTNMAQGEKIILVTNSSNYQMPDIIGWSRKDIETLFHLLGIKYQIDGYGYVIEQTISSGTYITLDMEIQVKLKNKFDIDPIEVTEEQNNENNIEENLEE